MRQTIYAVQLWVIKRKYCATSASFHTDQTTADRPGYQLHSSQAAGTESQWITLPRRKLRCRAITERESPNVIIVGSPSRYFEAR